MEDKQVKLTLFVNATITADFFYYGEGRTLTKTIGEIVEVNLQDLPNIKEAVAAMLGSKEYRETRRTMENTTYTVLLHTVNLLHSHVY